MPDAKRLIIIANPTAGASAGTPSRLRLLEAARRDLEHGGFEVEVCSESDPAAVALRASQALQQGFKTIVAAGGDGTVNAVVNGLMHGANDDPSNLREVALGVLPLGTGNVFAFNIGIAREWKAACRVIRQGHTRRIDLGLARTVAESTSENSEPTIESRYFLLMAGIGFDAKVVEETSLRLKYVLRDFAYVLKTLQNVVLHQGAQMTLHLFNGRTTKVYRREAWLVMIGNAASYAWDIKVTQHARLDDGLVDVCLMPFKNKMVSVQQAMEILIGRHVERGIAQYWKTKSVRVESEPSVPVQLDGDEWAHTPVEISVVPGALNVLAPPAASVVANAASIA